MLKRTIPSTGEQIPVIGIGTWKCFDVELKEEKQPLTEVLKQMKHAGATLIDSSPMYRNSEAVIGELTDEPEFDGCFFYATKVWTTGRQEGIKQMESSFKKMQRDTMDLMQIHNLTDWKTHLKTLREWKDQGKIRYIGITDYRDSMHEELEKIISTEAIDFVQFNYSIFSRNAEKRLLKASADHGVATLINRPFGEGKAFAAVNGRPLPEWAAEHSINSWSQLFLIYIVSHPDVTVVIPATSNPAHAATNFKLPFDSLPSEELRRKMADYADSL